MYAAIKLETLGFSCHQKIVSNFSSNVEGECQEAQYIFSPGQWNIDYLDSGVGFDYSASKFM